MSNEQHYERCLHLSKDTSARENARLVWSVGDDAKIDCGNMAESLVWPSRGMKHRVESLPSAYREPRVGRLGHGWAPGVYPSPCQDDPDFNLVVFRSRFAIRFSKYTPDFVLTLFESTLSILPYRRQGLSHLPHELCDAMKSTVSRLALAPWSETHMERREMHLIVENLVMAFSHEVRPTTCMTMLNAVVTQEPLSPCPFLLSMRKGNFDRWGIHTFATWNSAVDDGIEYAYGAPLGWTNHLVKKESSKCGRRICGMILDGFVQKMHPGHSLRYTYFDKQNIPIERTVGRTFDWTNNLCVPYATEETKTAVILSIALVRWNFTGSGEVDTSKFDSAVFVKGGGKVKEGHIQVKPSKIPRHSEETETGYVAGRFPAAIVSLIACFAWGADRLAMKQYLEDRAKRGKPVKWSSMTDV